MSLSFETRIAAAAAQEPKQLRQEFWRVLHLTAEANGRKRHRLGFRDVVFFRLKGSLEAEGMQLNRADRRDVYAVLSTKKHSAGSWERKRLKLTRTGDVPVSFDLTKIERSTQSALRIAKRGTSLVERRVPKCVRANPCLQERACRWRRLLSSFAQACRFRRSSRITRSFQKKHCATPGYAHAWARRLADQTRR